MTQHDNLKVVVVVDELRGVVCTGGAAELLAADVFSHSGHNGRATNLLRLGEAN